MTLQSEGLQLYQKETPAQMFFCEYCEIIWNNFFYRTPLLAVTGSKLGDLLTHFWKNVPML